jgi:hypothetical protein
MSEGTKRLVVGLSLVAAGVVGTLIVLRLTAPLADDDENPIRVRNKTLEFESEASRSEWVPEGTTKWRLKKNKHASDVFEVNAFGSSSPACLTPLSGTSVEVVFQPDSGGDPVTFTFKAEDEVEPEKEKKKEPTVEVGNVSMTADNGSYKKKLRPSQLQGHITQITVTRQTGSATICSFPAEPRVLVELCRQQC